MSSLSFNLNFRHIATNASASAEIDMVGSIADVLIAGKGMVGDFDLFSQRFEQVGCVNVPEVVDYDCYSMIYMIENGKFAVAELNVANDISDDAFVPTCEVLLVDSMRQALESFQEIIDRNKVSTLMNQLKGRQAHLNMVSYAH